LPKKNWEHFGRKNARAILAILIGLLAFGEHEKETMFPGLTILEKAE
jgi:hypothetical protein